MIRLQIKTDNAAFADDNRDREVARILRDLADSFEVGLVVDGRPIMDYNGNRVGFVGVKA